MAQNCAKSLHLVSRLRFEVTAPVGITLAAVLRSPHALAAYGLQSTPLGYRGTRGAQAHTALRLVSARIPFVIRRSTVVKARGYALVSFGWQATQP